MIGLLREKVSDVDLSDGIATCVNPYSYLRLRQQPDLLASLDRVYVDGAAMVVALRVVGIRIQRRSMDLTSMAREVLTTASRDGARVAFVGGRAGVADLAAQRLQQVVGPINVVHVGSGYFDNSQARAVAIASVRCAEPDVVLIGMGAPEQERFLVDLARSGWRGRGFTCGGFLHQTAGSIDGHYYPRAFRRARWLYRMIDEPRLVPRYVLLYPWFGLVFAYDAICDGLGRK